MMPPLGQSSHAPPGIGSLLRWVTRYALRRWRGMAAMLGALLANIAFNLLKPWPMKVLVDYGLVDRPLPTWLGHAVQRLPGEAAQENLILWCVVATIIVFLLSWILTATSAMANVGFGKRLSYDLAAELFAHLQRLSLRFHYRKPTGDTIRRVTTDSSCVSTIVQGALIPILTSTVTLVVIFVILWRLNSILTVASLSVVPLMALAFWRYANPMMTLGYRQQEADARIYTLLERTFSSMPVVQAFCREEDANRELQQHTTATLQAALATTNVQMKFKVSVGLATAMGTAAILYFGARQALAGELTIGSIIVFLSYLASLYRPLEALAFSSSTVQSAAGSARRVLDILHSDPEVKENTGARNLLRARGNVRFDAVTFGYEPTHPVLRNVSLDVAPGETIAIVGASGAGKSTLVSLIPRFFDPQEGSVRLDGRDLRELRLRDLRKNVGIVLQEPFLFPITVRENLAYGRPDATIEDIEAAARLANALEFIGELPDGYETIVGERGATLSGGQRQRLAIARAVLVDAPVLILDEPTSAVDARTESLIMEALQRLMKGRTTFIIAHRLSTVRNANRIVVMHEGRLAETGTHEELLACGGLYADIKQIQFGNQGHQGP